MKQFATTLAAATVSALSATTAFSQTTPAFNQGFQDGIKTELKRQAEQEYNKEKARFDQCVVRNVVTSRFNQDVVPVVQALKAILPNTHDTKLTYSTETGPTEFGTGTLVRLSYNKEETTQKTRDIPTISDVPSPKFSGGRMSNTADKEIVIAVVPVKSKNSADVSTEIHVRDFSQYGSRRDIAVTKGPEQISQLTGAWAARIAPEISLNLAKNIPEKNSGSYYAPRDPENCGPAPVLKLPTF